MLDLCTELWDRSGGVSHQERSVVETEGLCFPWGLPKKAQAL